MLINFVGQWKDMRVWSELCKSTVYYPTKIMLARTYDVEGDNDNHTHTHTHTYLYIKGVHRPPKQIKTKPPETEIEIGCFSREPRKTEKPTI